MSRVIITALIAGAIAIATPNPIHRRDYDRAFHAYVLSPSTENKVRFEAEGVKNGRIANLFAFGEFTLIFLILNGIVTLVQKSTKSGHSE